MKRFMSVALATAMIASMGVTAFAKSDKEPYDVKDITFVPSKEDAAAYGAHNGFEETTDADGKVTYKENKALADELYFVLWMNDYSNDETNATIGYITDGEDEFGADDKVTVDYDAIEDIDDLKATIKFTDGEEYVVDYYIDTVDESLSKYDGCYALILELNDNYTTKKQKIKGEITLKNKTKKLVDEKAFSFNLEAEKAVIEEGVTIAGGLGDEYEFDGEDVYINLVQFNDSNYIVADFSADVENIELEDDNGFYFDVKASDQGKLNLTYDNVAIKSVARMAPVDADLTFFNFYGYPEFDFTGKVTLTPEEDDVEYFVYSVAKDGSISKINAKLNDDGDAYEFKTRTLGCYVLSDMELDVEEDAAVEAPVVDDAPVAEDAVVVAPETGKTNPGTGC